MNKLWTPLKSIAQQGYSFFYAPSIAKYVTALLTLATVSLNAKHLKFGESLFISNCSACHYDGKNLILPEKDLKKATLTLSGINSLEALSYLITNGKNGMPAFGERLQEIEIEEIAKYILQPNGKRDNIFLFSFLLYNDIRQIEIILNKVPNL